MIMQRLLTVTTGYLKFTFACMVGGAVIFFLASLALIDPVKFLGVLAVLVAAFLIVHMEVRSHRRTRELSKRPDDPDADVRALVKYLAFAEATTMAASSIDALTNVTDAINEIRMDKAALWVSEWNYSYQPKEVSTPKAIQEGRDMWLAAFFDLLQHQRNLAVHGLYPLTISMRPLDLVVKTIQAKPVAEWSQVLHGSNKSRNTENSISILFLHDKQVPFQVDAVEKVLKDSFHMVRGGIEFQRLSNIARNTNDPPRAKTGSAIS
jgi:hypothetical protein